ncbi:MAG: OmpA family protein [Nevskia sp.]|nr:OmpA family protein [Nevskia sp.]
MRNRGRKPAAGTWQAVGPDQGRLPAPAGQAAEYDPLLRFTASGQPIVAGGNRQSVAVFRYDGSQWTAGTTAGIPGNGSLQPEVAFAMLGDEAALGWARVVSVNGRFINTPLVQTSDAADRYRAFGVDDGAVTQFSPGKEGHTDNLGNAAANQALSLARARAVRAALIGLDAGLAPRLGAQGYGTTRPQAGNTTLEGRAQNRRVELVLP